MEMTPEEHAEEAIKFAGSNMPTQTPQENREAELRGSFTTPVGFRLFVAFLYAWIFGKEVTMKGILIEKKSPLLNNHISNNK